MLGAGPVAIGRGAAHDLLGTDGCRALADIGLEVVVVNSNPSAVMTDPATAARTYVEPLSPPYVAKIVERERPDALLPTLGGRVALDLALALLDDGTLARFGVELVGGELAGLDRAGHGLDESLTGGKQFQLVVARDTGDRAVVACVIESLDPAGVHPDDSIAVTPAQTIGDPRDRRMREAALDAVREIGAVGVAEVHVAIRQRDGEPVVVGVDPLPGRGSAFAGKATGLSLGRIAARLAVGLPLEAFRPGGGHVTVKIPWWVADADPALGADVKSVGDVIGIGRGFKEALGKALRSLGASTRRLGLGRHPSAEELTRWLAVPTPDRLFAIADTFRAGWSTADVQALTGIDRWFLEHVRELAAFEDVITERALGERPVLRRAKRWGFADSRIAELTGCAEAEVRARRLHDGIVPTFVAVAPRARSLYSTYADAEAAPPRPGPAVVLLGPGPGRSGLEASRAQAAAAVRERGIAAVTIACDPAAVSADEDTLCIGPPTLEDVLDVVEREHPLGVIAQFGGRSGLDVARELGRAGVRVLGAPPEHLDRLGDVLAGLGLTEPPRATAASLREAHAAATRLGYPVIVRSDGRRAVAHGEAGLAPHVAAGHAVVVDKFLEDAIQVAVEAVSDGRRVFVAGVIEQIEKAGIHAADAACVVPPYSLGPDEVERVHRHAAALVRALGIEGLLHVELALKNDALHVLSVHPGASLTLPFLSTAIGVPLAGLAAGVLLGDALPPVDPASGGLVAVKEAVFPFRRLGGADVALGPAMTSTGEAMGLDTDFRKAYLKSQLAVGARLPTTGRVWLSARGSDRRPLVMLAKRLGHLGFFLVAAGDTARVLRRHGLAVEPLTGGDEPSRVVELMARGAIALAIDIPEDGPARARGAPPRREALRQDVPYYTTLDGAQAVIGALEILLEGDPTVVALQDAARPLARAA